MKTLRTGIVAGVALAAVAAMDGAALAAPPVEHEHYEFQELGSFDDCGFQIDYDWQGRGQFLIRELKGSDGQAFLLHDNHSFRTVFSNPATGAWMVVRGKSLFKEITGTHVEGDLWEFTAHEAGQPFVVEDSDGNVVARSSGLVIYRALFDTLGDGEPGGELLDVEVTAVHGQQGGSFDDLCDFAADLIG